MDIVWTDDIRSLAYSYFNLEFAGVLHTYIQAANVFLVRVRGGLGRDGEGVGIPRACGFEIHI
jgi:hypothetical protein